MGGFACWWSCIGKGAKPKQLIKAETETQTKVKKIMNILNQKEFKKLHGWFKSSTMLSGRPQIVIFCLVMDASYIVYTTKTLIDHNLRSVYQEDVQRCYPV